MNVVLGSAFRNSVRNNQLERWLAQAESLKIALWAWGHSMSVIAAEGDSIDHTRRALEEGLATRSIATTLVDVSHGGPVYGSCEAPERFKALQGVGNGILGAVGLDVDALVYVESDLIWRSEEIMGLIERLSASIDVVAPMIWAGDCFYDVYAFRDLKGERFGPFMPYSDCLRDRLLAEIGSAGSCLVMKGAVARECRITEKDGLVGFCRIARSKGYRIWVDSEREVRHPA